MEKKDWWVVSSVCLAFGGIGATVIFCFLIGFGLNTLIGKEALYTCFALLAVSLAVIRMRMRKLEHTPSAKMQRFHRVFSWLWRIGAALLLAALLLGFFGLPFNSPWVRLPCLFGTVLTPVGWVGILMSYHRRWQATQK